jgi:signal transduction histidine kinase
MAWAARCVAHAQALRMCHAFIHMNRLARPSQPLHPGLLRILRILAAARAGLAVLFVAVMVLSLGYFSPVMALPLITALLLLGFVRSSRMETKLGALHMPLAILLQTADALLITGHFPKVFVDRLIPVAERVLLTPTAIPPAPWLLSMGFAVNQSSPPFLPLIVLVNLFVLLIVVCWLYPMRIAVAYIAITTLVDVILSLLVSTWPLQALTLLTFTIARSVIFVILAGVITHLVSVQNQQQDSLLAANAKLTRYVSVVEELTISRERNRLARELHDTLAHTLSAASVQLEAADSLWLDDRERSHTAMRQAMSITRDGLGETRRALKALRASPLDDLGLALALKELGELTRQRSGAHVTVITPAQLEPLPAEVEQTLYRAAQEAFENIVRHAQARHVELSLHRQGAFISMTVRDDGVGFDVNSAQSQTERYGLNGMQERVSALGGRMTITSAPGAGTHITLEMTSNGDSSLVV